MLVERPHKPFASFVSFHHMLNGALGIRYDSEGSSCRRDEWRRCEEDLTDLLLLWTERLLALLRCNVDTTCVREGGVVPFGRTFVEQRVHQVTQVLDVRAE